MNRRKFLKVAGSAGVIVAAGGAGFGTFVSTRSPRSALQPWYTAGSQYTDPIRNALSYAILAPNPHNRQPWEVDLKSDTEAWLTCDLQRLLPATDPFNRQIVIGLGCFLELFMLAANHGGFQAWISLFPEGESSQYLDTRPVAHLKLSKDSTIVTDPLFAQVLNRHTNRQVYDTTRSIARDTLDKITNAAGSSLITGSVGKGPQLQNLRTLTRDALRSEILDPHAFGESIDLMRIGRTEIEASPDGIYLGGALLESLNYVGLLSREELSDPGSRSFQVGLDMAEEQAMTAMGFVWITTQSNERSEQIAAGRSYLRMALRITRLGLAMQPMSQALQEYPTMQPYYQQLHKMLASDAKQRIQMLARLGYADEVAPAPRWALATRIKRS